MSKAKNNNRITLKSKDHDTSLDIDPEAQRLMDEKGWRIDRTTRTLVSPSNMAVDLAGGRKPGMPRTQSWDITVNKGQLYGTYRQDNGATGTVNLSVSASTGFRREAQSLKTYADQMESDGGPALPPAKRAALERAVSGAVMTDHDLEALRN